MVHRNPTVCFSIVIKHRKLDDPGKMHLGRIKQFHLSANFFTKRIQTFATNFPSVGNEQQQVSRFSVHPLFDFCQLLFGKELGDRCKQRSVFFDSEPSQPFGTKVFLHHRGQVINLSPSVFRGTRLGVYASNKIPSLNGTLENAKLTLGTDVTAIHDFHPEPHVRRVVSKPSHRFVVSQPRKR